MSDKKYSAKEFEKQLHRAIKSCPIVYINHSHHQYVADALINIVQNYPDLKLSEQSILEYDTGIDGTVSFDTNKIESTYSGRIKSLLQCIVYSGTKQEFISQVTERERILADEVIKNKYLFVFRDSNALFKSIDTEGYPNSCLAHLQTFASKYEYGQYENTMTIIIVSPESIDTIPTSIAQYVTILNITPPTRKEIKQCVVDIAGRSCFEDIRLRKYAEDMVRTLQGLQLYDVKQILKTALSMTGIVDRQAVEIALEEKRQIVKKTGILDVQEADVKFQDVGGLKKLCNDLEIKSAIFANLDDAEKYNIPIPKGILIIGMPGCGKTMIAKATANKFGVPLLRLDISKLMGKYVGESEANLRLALATAEAAHPCILWIDEIEKAFAGSGSYSGDNDMLVMRMMGYFLTWMQERKTPVYLVATANGILRPEFMRKGRFDEVYFVDFPNTQEGADILSKKINQRYPSNDAHCLFDFSAILKNCTKVTEKMVNFSGSEIECVLNMVVERKFQEYLRDKELSNNPSNYTPQKIKVQILDFEKAIDDIKEHTMANQKGDEKNPTIIDQIYQMQKTYKFTSASEKAK